MNLNDLRLIGDVLFVEVTFFVSIFIISASFYAFNLKIFFQKKTHGYSLPTWAEEIYDRICASMKWGFVFNYYLPEMAKLQAGTLYDKVYLKFRGLMYKMHRIIKSIKSFINYHLSTN